MSEYGLLSDIQREIDIMYKLDNPHIIKLHNHFEDDHKVYLLLEYASGGTLFDKLNQHGQINEVKAALYLRELINAVKLLHSLNIIHKDIKPENILINNGCIKLADFGFCRKLKNDDLARTRVGSPIYMAPEILFDKPYTDKCDIFSLGVLLYEMLFARAPFESNSLPDLKR